VATQVSGAVCFDPWCEPVASGVVPSRATSRVRAAAARASTTPPSATIHARRSLFQLHSRPPRQRLPSSLVIEGVSAPALSCSSSYSRRDTSDNANDRSGVIRVLTHSRGRGILRPATLSTGSRFDAYENGRGCERFSTRPCVHACLAAFARRNPGCTPAVSPCSSAMRCNSDASSCRSSSRNAAHSAC
jgi:hypothetical protein